jgi:hypothetical protein
MSLSPAQFSGKTRKMRTKKAAKYPFGSTIEKKRGLVWLDTAHLDGNIDSSSTVLYAWNDVRERPPRTV